MITLKILIWQIDIIGKYSLICYYDSVHVILKFYYQLTIWGESENIGQDPASIISHNLIQTYENKWIKMFESVIENMLLNDFQRFN